MRSEFTSCRSTATELAVGNKESSPGTPKFPRISFTGELLSFRKHPAIHLVQHQQTGTYFALKHFAADDAPLPVLSHLQHPNLVKIISEETRKDGVWYFLEYVPSTVFLNLLMYGPQETPKALAMFQQVCEAVRYLHANGVHHGDIRPETVLVDHSGTAKLTSLGTAQGKATDSSKARDVRALARLLHEILTNEAFQGTFSTNLPDAAAALVRRAFAETLSVDSLLHDPLLAGDQQREEAVLLRLEQFMSTRPSRAASRRPRRQRRRFQFDFSSLQPGLT